MKHTRLINKQTELVNVKRFNLQWLSMSTEGRKTSAHIEYL